MALATLTSKGQLTVPKTVRKFLDLKPGDKVEMTPDGSGRVILRRMRPVQELFGLLPAGRLPTTDEELEEAIGTAVAEHVLDRP